MKELPYFRFTCQEWDNGDISLENDSIKGAFISICSYYWVKNCSVFSQKLFKKFPKNKQKIKKLIESGIIKEDGEYIRITFLDQQLTEITEKSDKLSRAGKKGVEAREKKRQATLKPPLSIKDKDKDKDKDKEEKLVFDSARVIFKGTKRGLETEYSNFQKHKDWKESLSKLKSSIEAETNHRQALSEKGEFLPNWKNFQTWINNRCWENEYNVEIVESITEQAVRRVLNGNR